MEEQAQTVPQFNGKLSFTDGFMHLKQVIADLAPDTIIVTGDCEGGKPIGDIGGKPARDMVSVCAYTRTGFDDEGTAQMKCVHEFTVTVGDVVNYVAFKQFLASCKLTQS